MNWKLCILLLLLFLLGGGGASYLLFSNPLPPPANRRVRYLNSKVNKPKIWVKEEVVPAPPTPVNPVLNDMGEVTFELDAAAKFLYVTLDTNGNDAEDPADFTKKFLMGPAVYVTCEVFATGMSTPPEFLMVFMKRDVLGAPWSVPQYEAHP